MADDNSKALIEAALGNLLEPIVAMLLRNGVTYQEFISFSKDTFVAVAQRDFGVRGRPTNSSRISAMTGIDRRDVGRIKEALADNANITRVRESQDRMSRVVRGWYEDKSFVSSEGQPQLIALEDGESSFKELARRYSGGLPFKAVLKELIASGNVAFVGDNTVRVLKPFYSPPGSNPEALLRAGTVINELSSTLFHNLYVVPNKKKESPRFERRASSNDLSVDDIDAFKAFLNTEGQAFLERVAAWIIEHETTNDDPKQRVRLGVGVFGIERKH
ncbi:MAG: DUF6502 family protein [Marinagarivorans sp.]|nr:DUF6502 family protein [Marinagarivorans sp.]